MERLITIIVPVYNVSQYLDKCVNSIINQTYRDLQIILVDDGSTDGSAKMCDAYCQVDSRIQVIHKLNGGLVSARKAGIQLAAGDYIGYVDGDDWIEPDLYEHLLQYAEETNADMVETDHYIESGGRQKLVRSKIGYGIRTAGELIPDMLCDEDFNECRMKPYVWSKLFKKTLLEPLQLQVDERIQCGEDGAVVYPYVLNSSRIYISDYAGYHYVQRNSSLTNSRNEDEFSRSTAFLDHLRACFIKTNYADIMLKQLNQYAKSVLMLRQISFFDRNEKSRVLMPFGGLEGGNRIVLYGAGKLGQSIYQYLEGKEQIQVVDWMDREYDMYREMGLPVHGPERFSCLQNNYDKVIIAGNSRKLAESIQADLLKIGIEKEKLIWLAESFIAQENNILELLV